MLITQNVYFFRLKNSLWREEHSLCIGRGSVSDTWVSKVGFLRRLSHFIYGLWKVAASEQEVLWCFSASFQLRNPAVRKVWEKGAGCRKGYGWQQWYRSLPIPALSCSGARKDEFFWSPLLLQLQQPLNPASSDSVLLFLYAGECVWLYCKRCTWATSSPKDGI